jgi:hypothetical protein
VRNVANIQGACHSAASLNEKKVKRKMNMSIPKMGCSMLLMAFTVLAIATLVYCSDRDSEATITPVSANQVYGYLPGEKLTFQIQSGWDVHAGPTENGEAYGKRMTRIEFYLGKKTLLVQAGGGELYIKGFDTSTGALTKLTTGEQNILRNALENHGNVNLGEHADLFLNSLDALSSWPKNMLVFVWHDAEKAMSAVGDDRLAAMPRKAFNARNTDAVKVVLLDRQAIENLPPPVLDMTATDVRQTESVLSVTSICFALGHKYTGHYFECDDFLCIGRTKHRYAHYVGGPNCFGRCGAGCSDFPHGRKYTRDCFNHDACVKNLGSSAESCDIMFTFCVDDTITAPKCPK